jgi:hypothetical protein
MITKPFDLKGFVMEQPMGPFVVQPSLIIQ